jgi:hypothetical protein
MGGASRRIRPALLCEPCWRQRDGDGCNGFIKSEEVSPSDRPGGPKPNPCSGPNASRRPLLIIDGDSFAHRSYYALPKTIRRSDGKGAGAIVGFANFLLRFYADERPRAVIVGWDTLDAPTKRHEMFPAYQSGRVFDEELIEQLSVLPDFVPPLGLRTPKPQGSKRTTFSPPPSPLRSAQAALL